MRASSLVLPGVGLCACVVAAVIPGTRELLGGFVTDFATKSLVDKVGAVSALVGLVTAVAGTTSSLKRREIKNLEEQVKIKQAHLDQANGKVARLRTDVAALEARTPTAVLRNALLAGTGASTAGKVVDLLQQGLDNAREPLAEIARKLAGRLSVRGEDDDMDRAAAALAVATTLDPKPEADNPIASVLAEHRAAVAWREGRYEPDAAEVQPVLTESVGTPEEAEALTCRLCERSDQAINAGDYFLAHRLACRATLTANASGLLPPTFMAGYARAEALVFSGHFAASLATIESFAGREAAALSGGHPNVLATAYLRAQVQSQLGRYDEALSTIDGFAGFLAAVRSNDHPDVLMTAYLRARVLSELGRYDEALTVIDGFASRQIKVLGAHCEQVGGTEALRAIVHDLVAKRLDTHASALAGLAEAARRYGSDTVAAESLRRLLRRVEVPKLAQVQA